MSVPVVVFPSPRVAELRTEPRRPLGPEEVRVRTEFSGISAGTELTAYRGVNPYMSRRWDAEARLFVPGDGTLAFPVVGWGYEEVGVVTELGSSASGVAVGDRVWGAWGHRAESVLPASIATRHRLDPSVDPRAGIFAKIGAIALNAVLDASTGPGETAVVFGLGVPGQLVASLLALSGARVIGVDLHPARRELALSRGVSRVLDPAATDVAVAVRELTDGRAADVAVEISGAGAALHDAIRSVAYNSRVVVSGFHTGAAEAVRLGEEFHHNRIQLVSSQISGVAPERQHRWDETRLQSAVMDLVAARSLPVLDLIGHTFPATAAADAFRLIDERPGDTLQVVLEF